MVLEPGDIILTREAPFGDVGMLRSDDQVFLGQRLVMYRPDLMECDPNFLMYSMMGPTVQAELKSLASGSTVEHLRVPDCEKITVPCPSLDDQKRIGSILRSLDDLIENNRRRVEVLEEMARVIYREWFVKFRYPGHKHVPFVDSVLGSIPEGWGFHPFSAVVEDHIGGGWGTEQGEPGSEEPGYVIRGTDIPRVAQSDVTTVPFRFHRESNLRSRRLRPGDIVFEVSGGSKGQPVGRSVLVRQSLLDEFDAPAMCASFCKLVRINPNVAEPTILIRVLQDAYTSGQLNSYQVQSTGITNFRWKPFLEHFKVVLPPEHLQKELVQTLERLDELVANSGRRIRALTQIRDMLLPKLVSGQIDVSSLELGAFIGAG
ncbi:hypothetical protein A5675_21125 [Mycobacterium malmoense]|nr:hypothetical protein A5675_21125 [Mycobacterium malmoense]